MANTVKVKRSATPSKVPTTSDLELGEIAVNTYDGKMYIKKDDGTASVVEIGGGSGSGDVVGPASATDNAVARFDTTTGKLIQNSVVTIDDAGNIAGVNAITFDVTPSTTPTAVGSTYWDEGNGTPSINLNNDVTLQLGQEMLALVYNGTGSTITNGSVVAVSGAQGQRPSVSLADADSEALSAPTLGIATQDIPNGAEGFVTTFGFVRGLNTSAFTAGAPIYLSQTAGQFTATRPSAPAHTVALGWVIKVNASSGEVFVNINNGWELDELHNVLITSPISGNTLIYDASVGVWKNANITAGTGISVTNGAGSITIANTGVTSVTATSPVASTGGTTPVISMPAATASVSGYLTSTDWNTFNNKTSNTGTVTSVATGTGLTGGTITTSGTISLANTSVTAGSYTNASITVDAQGRITAASSGSGGGVTSITGTANQITASASTGAVTLSLPSTINVNTSGNAATATTATTATYLSSTGQQNTIIGYSSPSTDVNSANDTGSFSVRGNSSTVASISFHRTGAYAINMGLGTDNVFRIGGWSASANAFRLDGSGNTTILGRATSTAWTTTGRNYSNEWIEFSNYSGLYSPLNSAHFYPNPSTYGSWRCDGSRNGWQGIEFAGQATLMMNDDNYGFHRNIGGGWRFYNSGGSIYCPGEVQAAWSDARFKENLRPVTTEALQLVNKFKVYRFNWNKKVEELDLPIKAGTEQLGLIAQEVQAVFPDAVAINQSLNTAHPDGTQTMSEYLTIKYDRITPLLVQSINELTKQVNELRAEIAELKGQK